MSLTRNRCPPTIKSSRFPTSSSLATRQRTPTNPTSSAKPTPRAKSQTCSAAKVQPRKSKIRGCWPKRRRRDSGGCEGKSRYGFNQITTEKARVIMTRAFDFQCSPLFQMKILRSKRVKILTLLALVGVVQPASSQETKRIRFAVTNPPHFLPIWLAKDTGIFSKHGLDVEVIFMRGGALITMGILSGELQLSGVGAESVVAAKVEGGDAVLLACPLDTDLVYLIGRPDIKTPEQLKGKSTAVTRLGSSIHFYL